MMSTKLRIELLIFAVLFLTIIFRSITKKRMQLRYSLLWLLIGLCILIAACFPAIIELVTTMVGIKIPANLIYFLGIVVLLILSYSHSVIVSKQSEQIKQLTQHLAIEQYLNRKMREEQKAARQPGEEIHSR